MLYEVITQVTYYSHVMPDFDQGTAQIGLWAQGRLDDRAKRAGTDPSYNFV